MPSLILLEGLEFYAYHGVPDAEQEVGHRYVVDLELEVEETASETDKVAETLDYSAAAGVVAKVIQGKQVRTLEYLAAQVGAALFQEFPLLENATVTIKKPNPPMPFIAKSAGVSVFLSR
ncbi:MAG: dihydroneopterin aldolase [Armatimonadetes bacterium]|nr:dihydroneopterin aldolase [Armatimonadota bacterium]